MDILCGYSDVLTVEDVLNILHLGRNKTYELLQLKVIPSIRIGKKYLIPKKSMIDFLTNQ